MGKSSTKTAHKVIKNMALNNTMERTLVYGTKPETKVRQSIVGFS